MKWQNPELINVDMVTKEDVVDVMEQESIDRVHWIVPPNLGKAIYEKWKEWYCDRQRTLDDIGWIQHEMDGL